MDPTPALLASFAIQAATEIVDASLSVALRGWQDWSKRGAVLRLLSFAVAAAAAFLGRIIIVGEGVWGQLLTALAISGGTEGVNSLMKIAAYSKERTKVLSGAKVPAVVQDGEMSLASFSMLSTPALLVDRPRRLTVQQCQEVVLSSTPSPIGNALPEDTLQLCGVDSPEKTRVFRAAVEKAMRDRSFLVDATTMPAAGTNTIREARNWLFSHHGDVSV